MTQEKLFGLAEASRKLGWLPKAISNALYEGKIDATGWPVIGGRRFVPASALPAIKAAIERRRRKKKVNPS